MDELTDFDIVSYETNENMFQIDSVNKSTQVNQVRNQIYLILHDNNAMVILTIDRMQKTL